MKIKKTIDPWTKEMTVWGVIDKDNKIKIWSQGKNLWFKFWKDGYPRSQGQIDKPDTIESTLSWFHKEYLEAQERRKETEYNLSVGSTYTIDLNSSPVSEVYTINSVENGVVTVGTTLNDLFQETYGERMRELLNGNLSLGRPQAAARDVVAETRDRLAAISTIAGRVDLIQRLHVDGILSMGEASELLNGIGEGL